MMQIKTNIYHCMNPEENPIPTWMGYRKKEEKKEPLDLVQQFKSNPDSFFPEFSKKSKR